MESNFQTWSSLATVAKYRFRSRLFSVEERILSDFASSPQTRVLDLGVGTGRTSNFFRNHPHYVAVDYSEAMIRAARKRYGSNEPGRFVVADARSLPFQDGSFDFVLFSFNGLDYVEAADRLKVLREVKRVLAPGGRFFFSTHNIRALGFQLGTLRSKWDKLSDRWRRLLLSALNPGTDLVETAQGERVVIRDMVTLHTHYISVAEQVEELGAAGLKPTWISDEDGSPIAFKNDEEARGKWFFILALSA